MIGKNSNSIILNSFLFNKKLKLDGLRSGKPIEDLYNRIANEKGVKYIRDIDFPLVITATNVVDENEYIFTSKKINDETKYIEDIEIGRAIRASSSFSVVFDPCKYKDKIFLDGGILDNVPVDEVRKLGADKVIAVKFNSDKITEFSNVMDIAMKTVDMMGNKISEMNLASSDLVITIDTDGTGLLDIENSEYCFNSGYKAGLENMDKIKKLIK
ncbi:MAG: patatin-like phospholipase family protein [Clostridia bacterium]|nr:patatin-like phospholipase family protein [Clostridia bacterium]